MPHGFFDLDKVRDARSANEKAPDDISGLLFCPTCGHTKLAGTLEIRGKWLRCTECHFSVSDTPSIRLWLRNVPKGSV